MSLFKRHISRRVTVVGVGVALLMLGLEAPAFAATTITSFSPLSGPVGCVVTITGTEFLTPDVVDVEFNNTNATSFTLVSDTEIWASVPVGATSGPIEVTNSAAVTAVSPTSFTVTSGTGAALAGGCAPTITSFTPTCGAAGTSVAITGTNLLRESGTAIAGGIVKFAPYPAVPAGGATHSNAATETPTSLTVFVQTGAADGPIRVNTWNDVIGEGAVLSTAAFAVPPPDCLTGGPTHARSTSLSLRKHLRARGRVSSTEDPAFTECVASVPVKIQRRRAGGWRTVGSTTTSDTGAYSRRIKDRPGRYRALAPKVTLASGDVCTRAVSPVRRHSH